MQNVLMVAAFGALGALARYWVSGWANTLAARVVGPHSACGTLAVNLVGCFLLGLLLHLTSDRSHAAYQWRIALGIGFLGAFTTFSTFGAETLYYLERREFVLAMGNIAANVTLGIGAVWTGDRLARWLCAA